MKQLVLALIFVGCADETASLPDLEDGSHGELAPLADPSSGDCP